MSIERAIVLKKELDSLRPLSKEDEERIMQKFRLDWNYHSNHLEGNSLTYGETKALILFGITAQGKPLQDHFEITGHDEAIKWVIEVVEEKRPLTENFIRQIHKLILKEPHEKDAITPEGNPTKKRISVGSYKTSPNHVRTRTGEIFRFASPEETPAKMNDLIQWYRGKVQDESVSPILLAADFHYRFVRIHPFDDGNGRTARILMNFILMQFGYPPVIIKTEDKANYFAALQLADAGTITPFVEYMAENLIHSLEIMLKGARGEEIEEPDDIEKEISLLEQRVKATGETFLTEQKRREKRSAKRVEEVYDLSLKNLIPIYVRKGRQFEKFYEQSKGSLMIGNAGASGKGDQFESFRLDRRKHADFAKVRQVNLYHEFEKFLQAGFDAFNFQSSITFRFEETSYFVQAGKLEITKLYGEQLSDTEINQLVRSEMKRHTAFIDAQIDQTRKKT